MNVKIPNSMKSPTVIIVGQGTMDEKKNDLHSKRMDNLERKLDQQYERFYSKKPKEQDLTPIIKSFSSKIESLEKSIKKIPVNNKNDNSALIKSFEKIVNRMENQKPSNNSVDYKALTGQLGSLENAIKGLKTQKVSVNTNGLSKSFNGLYERLEKAIRESRPRLTPSPS